MCSWANEGRGLSWNTVFLLNMQFVYCWDPGGPETREYTEILQLQGAVNRNSACPCWTFF